MKACKQTKRPPNVINGNPENERCFNKTVPGNSSYAEISREGRKTCIIGASLIKRIDMQEFNRYLEKGTAIKRSFPGATASRLKYYIEENIDRIIINVGTNNLSKKQSEEEIVDEIIKIVSKCHTYGLTKYMYPD